MAAVQYQHFTVEQLADGVYAAVATDEGSAACNAGIVVLDDRTIVFDTFATIPAAQELRAAAETLTGHPVSYVINSHVHSDHVLGNVVFAADACLIASNVTRTAMAATGVQRMDRFRDQISQSIRTCEEQLSGATDAELRTRLLHDLAVGRAFLAGFPTPAEFRVPQVSFADELTFHGSHRTAELIACGEGHSECDAVLYLREERILFSGDLFTEGDMVLRYGNPERWLSVLDRLEAMNPAVVVPGHGRVLPAAVALSGARQYIHGLLHDVERAVASGATEETAARMPVPAGQTEYWFRDNVRFLIGRLLAARQS